MMNRKYLIAILGALMIVLIAAAIVFAQKNSPNASPASPETDPQTLLIPRWFLAALTLDGQAADIPAGQQNMTIQFTPDGKINGDGGCNSFGGDYTAGKDGKMSFSPIASTMMACADEKDMQLESTYFHALAKVQQFKVADGKLTLSSNDGKTSVVFARPPK
jgi:heat shock protein HslJ